MARPTLRALCNQLDNVAFIRNAGPYAYVRIASPTGGEVKLVSRQWLEAALDESEAALAVSTPR